MDRPIIFSGQMVRAILDGSKTQTRRVIKPQPPDMHGVSFLEKIAKECPYGVVGDRLYVREAWDFRPMHSTREVIIGYKADDATKAFIAPDGFNTRVHKNWRPSIHMPKWASRIWLEITGIKVERVQDISDEDAAAEGIRKDYPFRQCPWRYGSDDRGCSTPLGPFRELWDSINAKRGYGWEVNPWVWCITFKQQALKGND